MNIPTNTVKWIILNEKNEFLLLQRNPKTRDKSNWDLPWGLIENNENEKSALIREIIEELNLSVEVIKNIWKWQFFRSLDKNNVKVKNYLCKIINWHIKLSEEHINYKWININELRNYPVKDNSLYKSLEKYFKN